MVSANIVVWFSTVLSMYYPCSLHSASSKTVAAITINWKPLLNQWKFWGRETMWPQTSWVFLRLTCSTNFLLVLKHYTQIPGRPPCDRAPWKLWKPWTWECWKLWSSLKTDILVGFNSTAKQEWQFHWAAEIRVQEIVQKLAISVRTGLKQRKLQRTGKPWQIPSLSGPIPLCISAAGKTHATS